MASFEDTKLLRHPTVERAYNEMRKFFLDGEDFAAEACRAGELITAHAKNPDPDAIAASVLLDGMIVRYQSSYFAATVSPRAAEIVENMYEFDLDDPVFPSAAEQQIALAHSIIGLEGVQNEIKSGHVRHAMEYNDVKRALDANEKSLLKIVEGTPESGMAVAAVEKLLIAKSALEDLVKNAQAALVFEKTGLPDHPLVREVYAYMKGENIQSHPLGGYTPTNTDIAKIVFETGASSDPEVLCAALLNQYHLHGEAKPPSEFSPRIGDLWDETSAWSHKEEKGTTEEGRIIRHAAHIHFAEGTLKGLADWKREGREMNFIALEQLEDMKKRLDSDLTEGAHPALAGRMRKAVAEAESLMTQPENVKIRKPGSPRRDLDW